MAYWPNITQATVPAGGVAPTSIIGVPFESPDNLNLMSSLGLTAGQMLMGKMGSQLVPDFKTLGNVTVPALDYPSAGGGGNVQIVAGDADGDGIADCLLFRIPGMSLDGLTWYAGVRIVDNNSAVNANTALSRDQEYGWSAGTFQSLGANSNYYALFQSSVGLLELLNAGDTGGTTSNFANFNTYEFGNVASPSQQPYADPTPSTANPSATPTTPIARTDFQFLTGGDALHSQLSSRIANPGFNGNGPRFQSAMPLSDEAALAYHFCLVNPETTLSQVPSSLIENLLPFSLSYYQAASAGPPQTPAKYYRYIPYGGNGAADVATWFNDNFSYDAPSNDYGNPAVFPLRSLIVAQNPVSNYITPVYDSNVTTVKGVTTGNVGEPIEPLGVPFPNNPYAEYAGAIPGMMLPYGTGLANNGAGPSNYVHYKGSWSATPISPYQFNDIVVGGDGYTYIWASPTSTSSSLPAADNVAPTLANLPLSTQVPTGLGLYQFWQFQPWTKSPVKANVNTATFRELYRAFWSVMAGNPSNQSAFGANFNTNPSTTTGFDPYWPDPSAGAGITSDPQHQFRSPLRDPTYTNSTPAANVTRLDPENTMLLRAALAAVNALGLRDNSQNVISRTAYLNAWISTGGGATVLTPVMARVYSNAPQPVISEVYANAFNGGANPNGYVAIELYNPYSTQMVLVNWQIGLINRSATTSGYPNLQFTTVGTPPAAVSVIAPPTAQMQAQNDPVSKTVGGVPAGTIIIPAHGYALLENYNAAGTVAIGDAAARPANGGFLVGTPPTAAQLTAIWYGPGSAAAPNTCDVYVPGLQLVIQNATGVTNGNTLSNGGELVLLRPRRPTVSSPTVQIP